MMCTSLQKLYCNIGFWKCFKSSLSGLHKSKT